MPVLEFVDLGLFYLNIVNWAFYLSSIWLNFALKMAKNGLFSNFTNFSAPVWYRGLNSHCKFAFLRSEAKRKRIASLSLRTGGKEFASLSLRIES